MLIAVGGEAFQIVLEEEFAEESGILVLHGKEPREHDGEVEQHARPPERALDDGPLAAQGSKCSNDEDGEERGYWAFGEGGDAGEEVDIEEPEFGVGFIPRVPAEQSDGERRGHLHVSGCAAGKADDAGASDSDERGVEVAAATKSPHVEIDERHHDEGEGGRGQAGAPVVHAEVLKDEHGAPVVEGRLLKPGVSVEVGSDAGAEVAFEGVRRVEADEHFMRNLRVAGLVGSNQPKTVAAEEGRDAVNDEKDRKHQKERRFANEGPGRGLGGNLGCGFHFQWFSNGPVHQSLGNTAVPVIYWGLGDPAGPADGARLATKFF